MIGPRELVAYEEMHRNPGMMAAGAATVPYAECIARLVRHYGARTLLDYGCGKPGHYAPPIELHKRWGGIMPTLYEPAVSGLHELPAGRFDGVICCDVAEHVAPELVQDFLRRVIGYGTKFVFFTICPRPAKKKLPDGRNAHLTVRPPEWWKLELQLAATIVEATEQIRPAVHYEFSP